MKLTTRSAEETARAAERFSECLRAGDAVLYTGEMGAGKTYFTKGIARHFGVPDGVCSPTFALVNEYMGGSIPIFHFDLFRIHSNDDLYAIGFFDYLDRGGILAVEWSESVPGLSEELTEELERVWLVDIRKTGEDSREISIQRAGQHENSWN